MSNGNRTWSNTSKPWDHARPFHRINSPSYDHARAPVDGRGYDCGCHTPDQGPGFFAEGPLDWLSDELMRTIPGWVPVGRLGNDPNYRDQLLEVEGKLVRSFQTWTDVPFYQWHRWYDWNLHIQPLRGYQYLRGLGNDHPSWLGDTLYGPGDTVHHGGTTYACRREHLAESGNEPGRGSDWKRHWAEVTGRPVVPGESMECEWDTGAFEEPHGDPSGPGAMFTPPMRWPMSGAHLWVAGHWIYDCGHATSENRQDLVSWRSGFVDNIPVIGHFTQERTSGRIVGETARHVTVQERSGRTVAIQRGDIVEIRRAGLTRSELHPCLAISTAWWEAEKFDENRHRVPALKFLFFASNLGGYKDFDRLRRGDQAGRDFEFILDLPRIDPPAPPEWFLGHTEAFPRNTGVLRGPVLLAKFDFLTRFVAGPVGQVEPIVEPIEAGEDGGQTPEQVKIRIPVTQLPANVKTYGVIVSLGWLDPDFIQARKVKRCRVRVSQFTKVNTRDRAPQDCNLKVCINGRWFYWEERRVRNGVPHPLNMEAEFWLHEEDAVSISAHGARTRGLHRFIRRPKSDREIELEDTSRVVVWDRDVDTGNLDQCHQTLGGITEKLIDVVGVRGALAVREESVPLGLIDPGFGPAEPANPLPIRAEPANPLPIRDLEGSRSFELTAFRTEADTHSAELMEFRIEGNEDYRISCEVTVQRQVVG